MPVDLIPLLKKVRKSGSDWTALCPAHDDKQSSLSVAHNEDKWLLRCHAGCETENIVAALGLKMSDLFDEEGGGGHYTPPNHTATLQRSLTLKEYAEAKKLPADFLEGVGLTDITYQHKTVVRIPYFGVDGSLLAVRFRIALEGDKFRWKGGAKPQLYGLNKLRDSEAVFLVEGESDCHTLWHHGYNAVGLPGASSWREDRDAQHLERYDRIYLVVEPDRGGDTLTSALQDSSLAERLALIFMPVEHKDVSALHCEDPDKFQERFSAYIDSATLLTDALKTEVEREAAEAWTQCRFLAQQPDILASFEDALRESGLVGETRTAKILYLAITSRLLDRPISVAVKGPSSGGKSYTVETVLTFFPEAAYYALTAMSERALAYSTEPISHRMLVIYEASGMEGDMETYLIRSLLSEGVVRYETVEKTANGLEAKLIERQGPTGLIVTTTKVRMHAENETRLLSVTVTDTQQQTAAIFQALAAERRHEPDTETWHALQVWLSGAEHRVAIPYAEVLANLVPPVATRLRRDFGMVLNAIKAHAILHQATRDRDETGVIVATLDDYAAVRELLYELVSEGVESTVPATVRDTVNAVAKLKGAGLEDVSLPKLAAELKLDKSAASRRARTASQRGYLINKEDKRGKPARYVPGDPLPDELVILPTAEQVLQCCSDAGGDKETPLPPVVPTEIAADEELFQTWEH